MTILQPIFWPPERNCLRCDNPYDPEKGGIKQGAYLFICPKCVPIVIPLLVNDLCDFGLPYRPSFSDVQTHRLRMIVKAGELARVALKARETKLHED